MALAPSSAKYAEMLLQLGHVGYVYPVDDVLGVSRLPFKMTLPVMLEIARESIRCESYEDAQHLLKRGFGIDINDDTMRKVTNSIGTLVFNNDLEFADSVKSNLDCGRLQFPINKKNHILYLEVDGAMLPTRQKDVKGIVYKENKLGMVFSSDNIRWCPTPRDKYRHEILKREYTPLIGDSNDFSKLFLQLLYVMATDYIIKQFYYLMVQHGLGI
jgi:hypothetical protein